MPSGIIVGFNKGEVSRNIESRVDLDLYSRACSKCENFDILLEGGIRNRSGTKFISKANVASSPAYLKDFSYSDDHSYVFEFGANTIRIWDNQSEEEIETLVSPYALADVRDIQFYRSFDVMWLVHPLYLEQTITRIAVDDFTIDATEYDYPPMMEINETAIELTPGANTGTAIALEADADLFESGHVGSYFVLEQTREGTVAPYAPRVSAATSAASYTSAELFVGFAEWTLITTGAYRGRLWIEQSTDGANWEVIVSFPDTTGGTATAYSHTFEGRAPKQARIRLRREYGASTMTYNLSVVSATNQGIVKITEVTDAQTAVCDIVNDLFDTSATTKWKEGAFSGKNGYPRTVGVFEERKWLCGTTAEPNTIWGSATDDFSNFYAGTRDDESIRRAPPVNGFASWISAKDSLILGTTNEIIPITGLTSTQGLTPENFKFKIPTSDGSSYQQAEQSNDTIIYVQKGGKKVRELIHNEDVNAFTTNDLTALARHITAPGILETAYQRLPDQRVICVLATGELAVLTYERNEQVVAWSRYVTDGDYISVAVVPSGENDSIWYCIKRGDEYFIEKQAGRELTENSGNYWFVDSAKSFCGKSGSMTIEVDEVTGYVKVTSVAHGLSNGDSVEFDGLTTMDKLSEAYTVSDKTVDTFLLKIEDGSAYYVYYLPAGESVQVGNEPAISVTGTGSLIDDIYSPYPSKLNSKPKYFGSLYKRNINNDGTVWRLIGYVGESEYEHVSTDYFPPKTGWTRTSGTGGTPTLTYTLPSDTGIFYSKQNELSGLDHLDGETVRAMGDNKYLGEFLVTSGAITLDDYYSDIVAGLPYTATASPLPLELLTQFLSVHSQKTVSDVVVKVKDTLGGRIGSSETDTEAICVRVLEDGIGEQKNLVNTDIQTYFFDVWDDAKYIYIIQDIPLPFELLSLTYNMQSGGR